MGKQNPDTKHLLVYYNRRTFGGCVVVDTVAPLDSMQSCVSISNVEGCSYTRTPFAGDNRDVHGDSKGTYCRWCQSFMGWIRNVHDALARGALSAKPLESQDIGERRCKERAQVFVFG